nr:MAG TPA: hypothetical protein [Caudoviricetes sp.]
MLSFCLPHFCLYLVLSVLDYIITQTKQMSIDILKLFKQK